jgi:hypothetical protein
METVTDELHWRKSSASGTGNCVEVAHLSAERIFVRNSKRTQDPALEFTKAEWQSFLIGVKRGEFDLPG